MESHVNIHYAKTHLSRLIERVAAGESVVIANAGRPVARLVPYQVDQRAVAPPGSLVGRGFFMGSDFDEPLDHLYDALRDPADDVAMRRVAEPAPAEVRDEGPDATSGTLPVDPSAQADGA